MPSLVTIEIPVEKQPSLAQGDGTSRNTTSTPTSSSTTAAVLTSHKDDNSNDNDMEEVQMLEPSSESSVVDTPAPNGKNSSSVSKVQSMTDSTESTASKKRKQQSIITPLNNGENEAPTSTSNSMGTSNIGSKSSSSHASDFISGNTAKSKTKAAAAAKVVASAKNVAPSKDAEVSNKKSRKTKTLLSFFSKSSTSATGTAASTATTKTAALASSKSAPPTSSSNKSRSGGDVLARLESSDTPTLPRSKKGTATTATIAANVKSSLSLPTSSASSSALKGMSAAQRSKLRSIVIGSTKKSSSQPTDDSSSTKVVVVAATSETETATKPTEQSEMDVVAAAAAEANATATANVESRPNHRRSLDESTVVSNGTSPSKKLKETPVADEPLVPSRSPSEQVNAKAAPTTTPTVSETIKVLSSTTRSVDKSVADDARHVVINLLDADHAPLASASKTTAHTDVSVVKRSFGMATPSVTTPGTAMTEPMTASSGSVATTAGAGGCTSSDTIDLEPPAAPSSELRHVQLFPLPSPPPVDTKPVSTVAPTIENRSTSTAALDVPSVAASTAGSDIVVCNDEGEDGALEPNESSPQTARSDTTDKLHDDKGRGSNRKRQTLSKSTSSASKNTPPAAPAPVDDAECNALLQKHASLRDTYVPRLQTLWQQGTVGLPEEDFSIPIVASMLTTPPVAAVAESPLQESSGFPAAALGALAALIEGRSDSLEELAVVATQALNALAASDDDSMPVEVEVSAVTAQIKLLATRQNYLRKAPSAAALENILIGEHNDSSNDLALWRWEVSAWTHLLPSDAIGKVKRARAARKRWSSQMAALVQLVAATNTADTALCDPAQPKSKRDALLALVGPAEEKVIKLEREAVTHRLAEAARQQKATAAQAQKEHDAQVKQQAKERKKLEAEAAKERKKQETEAAKERKKMEADAAKQLKRKESEEAKAARLAAAQEKEMAEQAELNRQKKALRSFFAKPAANKNKVHSSTTSAKEPGVVSGLVVETQPVPVLQASQRFDSSSFRARIGSRVNDANFLWSLSKPSAKRTSKRRRRGAKKHVSVPVLVTVYPEGYEDNPFSSEQPYTEQQFVSIANKYKFLSFHEDTRPAYYGTWSKRSKSISGRTPLAQDTQHLDYDVDSEEEWEADVDNDDCDEIQDEGNRSVDSNGNIDDEDGWLAAEDTEEHDGQGKDGQGLLGNLSQEAATTPQSRFIVPPFHGNPVTMASPTSVAHMDGLEGCTLGDAQDFVSTFYGIKLHNHELCLDAFPPSLAEENDPTMPVPAEKTSSMPDETLKDFARFVHNSILGSKDKVVDEFLQTQKSATACGSRALVYRTLDSMADKRRHPQGGVVWHVKKDVLERLGLECLASATEQTVEGAKHEALKTIAAFVHHNTTSSKEKLVDDLRSQHESVTRSRADALRIVQSIATKIKHPTQGGYYWCVQPDILEQVGLSPLVGKT